MNAARDARLDGPHRRARRYRCAVRGSRILLLSLFLSLPVAGNQPSIGLALGGGGTNGLAHIAMLEVFKFEQVDAQARPAVQQLREELREALNL